VHPACHRKGVGRRLVAFAEDEARRTGAHFLTVKTLGPSAQSSHYEATRRFYEAVGFLALEEFTAVWGEDNPCLLMAKPIV
jgi:GNAT superfamily N-acetyltransferase